MKTLLLAVTGAAIGLTAVAAEPAAAKPKVYTCTKWRHGVCVSTHRVRGTHPAYKVGYVFGPDYSYTAYSALPGPVTTYYKLDSNGRYVYSDGYVYVVDPTTYAVTRVLDVISR
jgi:hypothetical protein